MITLKKQHRGYNEYKNSDVQWVGRVPTGWTVDNLKHCLSRNDGGIWGDDFDDEGTIVFRSTEIDELGNWNFEEPARRKLTETERKIFKLHEGDLLLTKSSGSAQHLGKTALVTRKIEELECAYSNFMQRLRVNGKLYPKFLHYLINNEIGRSQINYWGMTTSGLVNLSRDLVNKFTFPIPSPKEQQSIASYLDEKCALIDRIIEGKKKQIQILEEQRAAIINRAVTKGLDESVEMKESGVEWIGEIPNDWKMRRIKTIAHVKRGASPRPIDDDKYFDDSGEYSWVRISDVTASDKYLLETTERLSLLGKSLSVPLEPDSLVISIAGSVGKPIITKIKCCIHDGFVCLKNLKCHPEYIYFIFSTGRPYEGLGKLGTQLNLNSDSIGNISIPLPPEKTQTEIIDFINLSCGKIDSVIQTVQHSVSLLNEYKSSLISHVVTGKVKVS